MAHAVPHGPIAFALLIVAALVRATLLAGDEPPLSAATQDRLPSSHLRHFLGTRRRHGRAWQHRQ